ncbi:glycine zipper 2TM domain-containing protein [Parasulfuritortus cantonensis]|uniref:Glycine zipper 2TM domain-containing protein n=1 Tax=Parasulfuritortus cantonensis TaxID=2528202 RepID=A0A4R1BCZ8_9PROT|nr:glycine zipper 2TM domain-containing protein [Parasulfuritortus cantonensis]TCJ14931.1 glycine zipper 2TM domain-containing protein [Parasulfuritortus cantonensis]
MNRYTFPALAMVALLATGCASGLGSDDYQRSDARRVYEVKMGVVESVRNVKIEGSKSGVGTATGAVVGGVAGSNIGQGKGAIVGAVLGAVAGGVAGKAIEEHATKTNGLELTVRLDSGRTIAIVQEDTGESFRVGDRVRLLESGGESRVTH